MGKFAWLVQAKYCWALSTNFWNTKNVEITIKCFALLPQVKFPANSLNFHWRWRWWDWAQAIFLNFFYFTFFRWANNVPLEIILTQLYCSTFVMFVFNVAFRPNEKENTQRIHKTFQTCGKLSNSYKMCQNFFRSCISLLFHYFHQMEMANLCTDDFQMWQIRLK